MKLLLNATVLTQGGSLQAAVNFIGQALMDAGVDWFFAVSRPLYAELEKAFPGNRGLAGRLIHCERSPAKNFFSRRRIRSVARTLGVDAVFTLFGPAYVSFHAPHVMGFANSWLTHANHLAIATLPGPLQRAQFRWSAAYKRQWLRAADLWVVEAEAARQGLQRRAGIDPALIRVVPNGCRDEFKRTVTATQQLLSATSKVRILYVSSYYRHKNFEIIPRVARALQHHLGGREFEFVLTLDPAGEAAKRLQAEAERRGVTAHMRWVGRVPVAEIAQLYASAHIAFIPTLLESFSAAYSEAMSCGLPIVTSDLDFAHSICGNAALYFDPLDAESAATALHTVVTQADVRQAMVEAGRRIAGQLPGTREKYELYKDAIISCLEASA